jgi:hypothetical protein
MLDMVMAGFAMLALWLAASALGERGAVLRRLRLAGCGACLGLAMGAKWSVLPMAVVAGGLLLAKWRRGDAVLPGVSLAEMLAWLVSFPLLVYWLTFWPAFFYRHDAVSPAGLVGWHRYMLDLQASVTKHHPYQSVWWQWVIDARSIWYLYEVTDGAQRGIMLIGNPFSMLAGLAALGWAGGGADAGGGAGGALCSQPAAVDRGAQAGAVLLPLSAALHLSDGRAGAGGRRAVAGGRHGARRWACWCWRWRCSDGSGRSSRPPRCTRAAPVLKTGCGWTSGARRGRAGRRPGLAVSDCGSFRSLRFFRHG